MPPTNPRKRPAPGSSPVSMPQSFPTPSPMSNADLLRWNQGADNNGYPDAAAFNMNNFAGHALSQAGYDPASSTQVARRPNNRQLVPTAQRGAFDTSPGPWTQFSEDTMIDPQISNGGEMEENDNIEILEERAAVAKRDAQSKRKQIPPFVQKLSSFLDESKNTELIRWSDRGDSFVVLDEDEFAKTLIPELFKHNNYASFVRQLNMYGFHKRVGLSDNSMKASERKNKSPSEYYNPYFKRGHPNLLWLINKPKGGSGQKKGKGRVKAEEGDGDSDDDGRDGAEEIGPGYTNALPGPRAITAAPESGPLQKRELVVVQSQLAEIQKQQEAISNAINRLRMEHNALYQQATAFQTMHDRHENSINAILTFLATIYNRSMDGQTPQNIAQMFAGVATSDQQHGSQGNVVDIGQVETPTQSTASNTSPHRKAQYLLMAPPNPDRAGSNGRAATLSPAATSASSPCNTNAHSNGTRFGTVEEVFDTSPGDSSQLKVETGSHPSQQGIMDLINNTNAQSGTSEQAMEFPEMLSHFEHANGQSPLTADQRRNMLQMIANTTSPTGINNALVTPSPVQPINFEELNAARKELDEIGRVQNLQSNQLEKISSSLAPLSPSGTIPGLTDNSYFTDPADLNNANLDLDQFLDSGAYYTGSSPLGGTYNYSDFQDGGFGPNFSGMDGTVETPDSKGRIVDAGGSSQEATPEAIVDDSSQNYQASPVKRRRKE